MGARKSHEPFFRSPRFLLLILLSTLLATSFLGFLYKHVIWIPWNSVPPEPWPTSQSLWPIVCQEPRAENRCRLSACPSSTHEETKAPLKDASNQNVTTVCPSYFRWIHEDLAPWRNSRISRQLLERARDFGASFRVVIKSGRLFVEPYGNCYQTRAVFSIWGFLQLLRFYPGLIPDVELVFGCGDRPEVLKQDHEGQLPPPVFRYCTTVKHFDIPFPDWSFWGWPEVGIKPWKEELHSILQGANRQPWAERHPTAFWKGNTFMGDGTRMELLKCKGNGAQIFGQDWAKEVKSRFRHSKLSEQCKNRYKVYVEGIGWSVSLKYILACDSPVLLIDPENVEFFARGLVPKQHYWPIRRSRLCEAIKFAVDWGNNHTSEAEKLGRAGSGFVREEVSMERVYEYMLHAVREYASLLDFEPMEGNLTELCAEAFMCVAPEGEVAMYESSLVRRSSQTRPCELLSKQLHVQDESEDRGT